MIVITNSIVCLSLWCSLVNVSEKSFIFPLYDINFLVNDIPLRNGSSVVLEHIKEEDITTRYHPHIIDTGSVPVKKVARIVLGIW